ncbi:MAG: ABC transporter substrate-binding protein [Nitrospinae bacterium]|nr:ABC transporter substrate-binding protein [Nitrospinota bacterium]
MSTALSGPVSALGRGMKQGVEAHFKKVNDAGGVHGHMLRLVALDDSYQPEPAVANVHRLIDQDHAIALLGNVGTPTASVTVPIVNDKKVLLFGPFTGAGLLRRSPPDRYVINYRASYVEETAAMIQGLLKLGVKPQQIAFFTQEDAYGDSGYEGGTRALRAVGYKDAGKLAHGRYKRNTLNVEDGLITILDAKIKPRAIIMVGAYAPCAKFIKLARKLLQGTLFLNVSFVGSDALAAALGRDGEGVIITQVVPHYETDLPGVVEYRQALGKYAPDATPGFVSLEGYLAAKIFVEGLKRTGNPPTRENVVDGIESLKDLDIGIGIKLTYSTTEHQGSHKVWATVIKEGKFVPLDW